MESAFERPNEFIPERWYSLPHLVKDKDAFGPFSFGNINALPKRHCILGTQLTSFLGNRQCVGKVLAYAELRLVAATILKHYNVRFAPGYDPEVMWRDMKDQVTAQPGQVLCVFESRNSNDDS